MLFRSLRDELSGGTIEQGVERGFIRPAAGQTARNVSGLLTSAGTGYGIAAHNPAATFAGGVGLLGSYPPVSSNAALLLGSPFGRAMLGRYLGATMAPDVYGAQESQ